MSEGVLFVMSPIWWQGHISATAICFSAISALIFMWVIKKLKRIQQSNQQKKSAPYRIPTLPNSMEENFSEKILYILRTYSQNHYAPKHSRSHTNKDILSYVPRQDIITLWKELEEHIYSGAPLDTETKNSILSRLRIIL